LSYLAGVCYKNGLQNSKACNKNWFQSISTIGIFEENKKHTFFSDQFFFFPPLFLVPPGKVETYELKRVEVKLVGDVLGDGRSRAPSDLYTLFRG